MFKYKFVITRINFVITQLGRVIHNIAGSKYWIARSSRAMTINQAITISLILIATAAIYFQTKNNDFVNYDDDLYVTSNPHVKSGLNKQSIKWAFTNTKAGNWQPLTFLSHMAVVEVFGLDAGKHHLMNLFIHLFNIALLFFILLKITNSTWKSSLVVLLFAIHPLNVGSVAWISERKGLLSCFFVFLSILSYIRYRKTHNWINYFLVIIFFVLGLMCKATVLVLPVILLVIDCNLKNSVLQCDEREQNSACLPRRSNAKISTSRSSLLTLASAKLNSFLLKLVSAPLHLFLIAAIFAIANIFIQNTTSALHPIKALISYTTHLKQTFLPLKLTAFYPAPQTYPMWQIILSILILTLISFFAIKYRKQKPYFLFGWLWFVICLLPVSGILSIGSGQWLIADRYMYLPIIGICIMVVGSINKFIVMLTIPILILITHNQIQPWENSITLFEHATRVTKNNYLAYNHLGLATQNIDYYKKAVQIKPNYAIAYNNLGTAFKEHNQLNEAIASYSKAIALKPNFSYAYNNLGTVIFTKGNTQEAVALFKKAISLNPNYLEAYMNLGNATSDIKYYFKAIEIDPGFANAYNDIGVLLEKQSRVNEAILYYSKAIKLDQNCHFAYDNLKRLGM